jgi:hypothetical protein
MRTLVFSLALFLTALASPAAAQFRDGTPLDAAPRLPRFATRGAMEEALHRAELALEPARPPIPEDADAEKLGEWIQRDLEPWARMRMGAVVDVSAELGQLAERSPEHRVIALAVTAILCHQLGHELLMIALEPRLAESPIAARAIALGLAQRGVQWWRTAQLLFRRASASEADRRVAAWADYADARADELDHALLQWDAAPPE